MKKQFIICVVLLTNILTTTAFAESADHVVCSLSERLNEKPWLKEVYTIYFKKGGYNHAMTFEYLNKETDFIVIERPQGISRVFIQPGPKTLLAFESASPAPFVGDYSLPTISISNEKLYLMCREWDRKTIAEEFPNATLIK